MPAHSINLVNRNPLRYDGDAQVDGNGVVYPIIYGIPRVCERSDHAGNSGKQWNLFRLTPIDPAEAGQTLGPLRFFVEAGWLPQQLDGVDMLGVGSGAGRFTCVVLEHTRADLCSVDCSSAIEANLKANRDFADRAGLDKFDMFSAEHDNPQRFDAVAEMFRRSGAEVTVTGFVELENSRAAVVCAVRTDVNASVDG